MEANRILLQKKYSRIIHMLADKNEVSVEEAMKIFYESNVYQMLSKGEADIHCRSDYYIFDEILLEIEYEEQIKRGFVDRMEAYVNAFSKLKTEQNQKED